MPRRRIFPLITVPCRNCGQPITTSQNRLDDGRGRFCSRACSASYTHKGRPKPLRSAETRAKLGAAHRGKAPYNKGELVELTCPICSNTFKVRPTRVRQGAKYCSRACMDEAKRRVTGPDHKLYKERLLRHCEWCGEEVWIKPCKASEFRFCSRRCVGSHISAMLAEHKGPTSIERTLAQELARRSIHFSIQYQIGPWLVDFALPELRIVIEADGAYWHGNPTQKAKDARKDHWLQAHKWTIYRFGEAEIKATPAACIDRVTGQTHQLPLALPAEEHTGN